MAAARLGKVRLAGLVIRQTADGPRKVVEVPGQAEPNLVPLTPQEKTLYGDRADQHDGVLEVFDYLGIKTAEDLAKTTDEALLEALPRLTPPAIAQLRKNLQHLLDPKEQKSEGKPAKTSQGQPVEVSSRSRKSG